MKRKGLARAYADSTDEYQLVRELLAARAKAGLTQEQVAESMGTTKSAVSRLEAVGKHSPSVSTLKKYAGAGTTKLLERVARGPVDHAAARISGLTSAARLRAEG
jgi:transcriptional regulator with XRE-family HTH domain